MWWVGKGPLDATVVRFKAGNCGKNLLSRRRGAAAVTADTLTVGTSLLFAYSYQQVSGTREMAQRDQKKRS